MIVDPPKKWFDDDAIMASKCWREKDPRNG